MSDFTGGPSVLAAVLSTLSNEKGPCPTLFRASPASTLLCQGAEIRVAPGWWVAFACDVEVDGVLEQGFSALESVEVVTIHFTPTSHELHNGEAWRWELSLQVRDGERRLVLRDLAEYPAPLLNVLQYHAIGQCREALLRGAARRLEAELPSRFPTLAAVSRGISAFFSAGSQQRGPGGRDREPKVGEAAWPADVGAAPPAAVDVSGSPIGRDFEHPRLPSRPSPPPDAFRVLDATPRADAASGEPSPATPAPHAPVATAGAASPPPDGASYSISFDDSLDSLRALLPNRSSDTLRKLLKEHGSVAAAAANAGVA